MEIVHVIEIIFFLDDFKWRGKNVEGRSLSMSIDILRFQPPTKKQLPNSI